MLFTYVYVVFLTTVLVAGKIDPWEVRCHVCKATVREMEEAVAKVDPKRTVEISGFRLDATGSSGAKTVQYVKSEMYLTELMENICKKMDDYAKATHKKTGKLTILKMMTASGQMNPEISSYDFVQDGDLNKSLEHYCLEILEDHENSFLEEFQQKSLGTDIDIKICSLKGKYCKESIVQEEYKLEDEL